MFGYLTDSINNAIDTVDKTLTGEGPTKKQVSRMVDDGLTVAGIAATFSVAEEVITDLIDD